MNHWGELIPHNAELAEIGLCLCDSCCEAPDPDDGETE